MAESQLWHWVDKHAQLGHFRGRAGKHTDLSLPQPSSPLPLPPMGKSNQAREPGSIVQEALRDHAEKGAE